MKVVHHAALLAVLGLGIGLTPVLASSARVAAPTHRLLDDDGDKKENEKKVAVADLPAPVTAAVKKAVPDGTITSAEVETEDGVNRYELKVSADGKTLKFKVNEDGTNLKEKSAKDDDDDDKDGK